MRVLNPYSRLACVLATNRNPPVRGVCNVRDRKNSRSVSFTLAMYGQITGAAADYYERVTRHL